MHALIGSLRAVFAALFLLMLWSSGAVAQKWVKLAPFPEASEEVYGIASGGKMYVFGGLGPRWTPKGLVYEYDPASDKWTKKKPMALPSHHVALAEWNGKIYVMGGFVLPKSGPPAWEPISNAWEYDPANDSWKALAPMPTKRGSPIAEAVDGKIYVIGGRVGAAFMTTPASATDIVEEYDPATDHWGPLKRSMATPRSAAAFATYKGKIYVAGGEMRDVKIWGAFSVVEALDPGANRWITLPSMNVPRHGHAAAVIGHRLHLVSGDVQSLGGSKPADVQVETNLHEALDLPEN